MSLEALIPTRVLTPSGFESGRAVLIEGGTIIDVVPASDCPAGVRLSEIDGDLLPGFIDLQVNGGGGVLFNDQPTVDGIAAIARAHRRFGTTGLLPTLISDDLEVVARAIAAVDEAIERQVPGIMGIHIEGPFLNPAKKGIHDNSKFRLLDQQAMEILCSLKRGRTLVTLAPELAPAGAVRALTQRGVIVAAGHTEARFEQVEAALAEGLAGFTHLYNAMTQLQSRAPGAVGAALDDDRSWCGLIVDGHHVHPAALRVAYKAKGAHKVALVTDAMPTVGSDLKEFRLGARRIVAENGRCTDEAGTLAGSDLDMASAVRNAEAMMGVNFATAIEMASQSPARAIGLAHRAGSIKAGAKADLVLMNAQKKVGQTWIAGEAERH
ncbi:MAG: N-acetylglucosamine-6-phosphate deacetylase [uncultured Sphingomonadaceae bacterium]|uniref:N-acetylglucosamine-6-phosphate deacetylase n=1 Tax=uncultured Sphingomonadaceae bacterium TaxID=169976 RepID=A0A6J4TUT6_9SPHN|nr:MAG: N-acetylglucosamine-6-phosphate deacetylase [uncultured Sphingomonadaceae bacterium]